MKSILDPSFVYTPAASTDLRKTFARLRREAKAREKADTERKAIDQSAIKSIFAIRRAAK